MIVKPSRDLVIVKHFRKVPSLPEVALQRSLYESTSVLPEVRKYFRKYDKHTRSVPFFESCVYFYSYVCTRTCTYHNNTIFDSTKVRKYENIYLRSTVVVRVALARYWYSRRLPSKVARATS